MPEPEEEQEVLDTAQDDLVAEDHSRATKRQKITESHSINSGEQDFEPSEDAVVQENQVEVEEEVVPPVPVVVESAKRNMMDYIVATAARSAIKFNA